MPGAEVDRGVADARLGTVLRGKYTVDSILGVGGMAVVYAVTHRNRKRFALKMLHPELSRQSAMRERFLREGYVANTVGHPGAVAVLDDDVDDTGAAFLVMELLEGKSVERIWEEGAHRMPANAVANLAYQLLEVLAAAHAKGIVHRDIKPANLFLTNEGHLKVLDFGIARLREAADVGRTTNTGALYGTPAFMSPEQAAGRFREVDGQTDVWAVGATMYTLLTGRIVHDAENAHALLVAAATHDPPPVSRHAPDVPQELATVVDHALARDKKDRWPTATAMREAIGTAHRAVFGAEITRGRPTSLAPPDAALLRTVDAGSGEVLPAPRSALAETLIEPPAAAATSSVAQRTGPAVGPMSSPAASTVEFSSPGPAVIPASTDAAVSPLVAAAATAGTDVSAALSLNGSTGPAPMTTSRAGMGGSRVALLAGIPLVILVVGGGAWVVLRGAGHAIGPASDVSVLSASGSTVPAPAPTVPPEPPTPSAAMAPDVAPSSSTALLAAPPAGTAAGAPRATSRSGPPKPSASPSQGQSDCFYFDAKLNRIVAKPGCR